MHAASSSTPRPYRLGLTGGIGSGKSTVAQRLQARGATIIDADHISRSLTATGGAALPAIAQVFGADLIDAQGALNRVRMRELVFSSPDARHQLEGILHPMIAEQTRQQHEAAIACGSKLIVHDIPLLVESGHWRTRLDGVLVVDCQESTQIARVMARNSMSADAVQAIMATQASRAQRLAAADWVIYNDADVSLDTLHTFTDQIATWFGL